LSTEWPVVVWDVGALPVDAEQSAFRFGSTPSTARTFVCTELGPMPHTKAAILIAAIDPAFCSGEALRPGKTEEESKYD